MMSVFGWILFGLITGFVASRVVARQGQGCILNVVLGIVGACGHVERGQVYQAKGFPYSTAELFGPSQDASIFEGGRFITLRLTSAMYHRFHAPADATVVVSAGPRRT